MAIEMKVREMAVKTGTEETEYKGNPMLTLHGNHQPFSFGYNKAKSIVEFNKDIIAFVQKCEAKKSKGQ